MSEAMLTGEQYCEVYDEPRHRFHLRNEWTNVYEIELPKEQETWFHRHTEDTMYVVVADAEVRESFQDKPAKMTTAKAGGTLCRAHHEEHLIHQVKNLGANNMHMVGAEALARPPRTSATAVALPSHKLSWESSRFRVYDVATSALAQAFDCEVFGLLVSLCECTVQIGADGASGLTQSGQRAGSFLWFEPTQHIVMPANFRGIFAEWI